MRVVQKNLVFVVGLSPRLADPEVLKKPDYFGKFGKIHKVVINHSTQYAGTQVQVSRLTEPSVGSVETSNTKPTNGNNQRTGGGPLALII